MGRALALGGDQSLRGRPRPAAPSIAPAFRAGKDLKAHD